MTREKLTKNRAWMDTDKHGRTRTDWALRALCVVLLALATVAGVVSCSKPGSVHAEAKTLYTCGMHPQIIQDHPGNCPICDMKLTPIRKAAIQTGPAAGSPGARKIKFYKSTMNAGETSPNPGKDSMGMDLVPVYEEGGGDSNPATISIDPVTVQNMGIRLAEVTRGPLRRSIRTVGVIDYDETTQTDVTVKFKGWIEKLYVDATGQSVKKGEPLFDVYSPDLVSAQNEYLLAMQAGASPSLKASARLKLSYFDISDDQIAELQRNRKIRRTLRVDSPRTGVVVEKMAVYGQMVDAGMKLYRLADLSLVWVQSQIYEQDLAYVKLGQEAEVTLSYLPDRKFRGRVTYIYPSVDEKTRTARVRMEFHNPGLFLKPGMFAKVNLEAKLEDSAILVPDSAVLRSGEKNTVFVQREPGKFDPRTVALGPRGEGNFYQVLSGLKPGEQVVMSGQFLFDSESQLKEAIQKMMEPDKSAAASSPSPADSGASVSVPADSTPKWQPAPEPEPTRYVCPMIEHASIQYDHPGKCPLCGMTMIPAEKPESAKTAPKPAHP